jgi:3-dehydroquinate synthase
MTRSSLEAQERSGLFTVGSPVSHWTVTAERSFSYEIRICDGVLDPGNPALLEGAGNDGGHRRRLIVTDTTVDALYGHEIREYFDCHRVTHEVCVLPAGEVAKDFSSARRLAAALDAFGIDRRREPVIAIGGGVLLDIAGFVCSTYRRATPYIRVPTTLIGLVDAGIGVKTGLNFNGHKNRLGTYFPAERGLLDRSFLRTLDGRHISNGLAEIAKIALIKDAELFAVLERHGQNLLASKFQSAAEQLDPLANVAPQDRFKVRPSVPEPGMEVMERAVHGMLEELQPNLWESVLERVVDYGHTFSPSMEMLALPELLHGEAVAVDMALCTVLAESRGLVSGVQRGRILRLLRGLGLPVWHELCRADVLLAALDSAVAHRDGAQRMPLPVGIGAAVFVNDVAAGEIVEAAEALREWGTVR